MKIILSNQCESLTGSIGQGLGYFIVKRKNGFYSVRSKHNVPPDGHWRFIVACADLAHKRLQVTDISLHWTELYDALYEAYHFVAADQVGWNGREAKKLTYNAADILNLKTLFGL